MKLALKGILDLEVMQLASQLGMSEVSFDFRPRSFNFTQGYKVKELLSYGGQFDSLNLIFENEKDFIIEQILKDLNPEEHSMMLEFSGGESLTWADRFETPFIWHYKAETSLSQIEQSKFLRRIVFNQEVLDHYNQTGELFGFFQLFTDRENLELEILTDWDNPLIISLIDNFDISHLSFEINNKVERSFRNVDHGLVKTHIKQIQQSLN